MKSDIDISWVLVVANLRWLPSYNQFPSSRPMLAMRGLSPQQTGLLYPMTKSVPLEEAVLQHQVSSSKPEVAL